MVKNFLFFLVITFISCKQSSKTETVKEFIKPISDTFRIDTPKNNPVKLIPTSPPSDYELSMFRKIKNISSGAQFLRQFFTLGNLSSQVEKVQGYPNDKVDMGNYIEVWFYNNCEITISNGIVRKVENSKGCLNYIDLTKCIYSNDDQVQKNAMHIVDELVEKKIVH